MITYILNVKMADTSLKIDDKMLSIISECTSAANDTVVSKREKRTYSVLGRKDNDEYTIQIQLTTKNPVNPTRSLSTLARKVIENEYMSKLLEGHTPNGSVFKSEIVNESEDSVIYISDTEIMSEIISIFFNNDLLPKEKTLASDTAESIRSIIIDYVNAKKTL